MAEQPGLIQLAPPPNPTVPAPTTTGQIGAATAPPPAPVPPVMSFNPASGTPGSATSTGYQATPYTVDPAKGTVQGQLDGLLQKGSPYLEAAKTPAMQAMNDRGILSSTMAISAGEEARIKAALPIAQADAGIHNQAMTNTVNQENAASQFGASAENSAAQLNAQLLSSMNQFNANAQNSAMSQAAQEANARALASIDTNTRMQLATLDTQNRALLQASVGASNAYVQAVTNISNISNNQTMSREAKDAAIATQVNLLREQLRTISHISATDSQLVADLNLDEFFDPVAEVAQMSPTEIQQTRSQYQTEVEQALQSLNNIRPEEYAAGSATHQTANYNTILRARQEAYAGALRRLQQFDADAAAVGGTQS